MQGDVLRHVQGLFTEVQILFNLCVASDAAVILLGSILNALEM